jgi:hypothetical protein
MAEAGLEVREEIFLFSTPLKPAMEPTQPHIRWVRGALSYRDKADRREADHSTPLSVEIKNGGAVPPLHHTTFCCGA